LIFTNAVRSDQRLPIVFQDEDLVAVAKPAGLAVIPGRGEDDSVLQRLAEQLRLPWSGTSDPRIRVVHRLDKDTSGLLLFARHLDAQRHLSNQFQNNTIEKQYLALIAGRPDESEGEIDAPIGAHPTSPKRMAVLKHGGRPARTLWKIEQTFRHYTLLRVFPRTGKTHQIRVHLAHIGLPLAIDPLYSPNHENAIFLSQFKRGYRPKRGEQERPLISRLTLHAQRLSFEHPSGQKVQLEAHLPKDLCAALNMLKKYDSR
jgi:23S rRNA pseudouridine1911/1915/1917 synthase